MDVKNYLATIRESSGAQKSEALNSLFLKSTDPQIKQQVISQDGIKILVSCLTDESHKKVGVNASGILVNCLSEPEAVQQVGKSGLGPAIKFLDMSVKASDKKGIEFGSGVLMNVCSDKTFHKQISQGKGQRILKRALRRAQKDNNQRAVSNCLGAISHLCNEKSLREYFNNKNLLGCFIQMLSSPDVECRKTASSGLWNLGLIDEETRLFLVKHHAVEGLLKALENNEENLEVLNNCATTMAILTSSEKVCNEMRKDNQFESLCKLISSEHDSIPQGLSISVWNIALTNEENKQELAKYQALSKLIPLLQKLNQKSDWNSLEQVLSAVLACSTHEKLAESFKKDPKDGLKTLKTIIEGENHDIQVKALTNNDQKKCILYAVISFIVMTYSETNPGIMYENKMLFMVLIDLLLGGTANSLFGNVSTSIVNDLQNFKTKYQLPDQFKLGMTVALPEEDENDVDDSQPKDETALLKDLIKMMGDEEFLEKLRPEERRELETAVDSAIDVLENNEGNVDPVKDSLADTAADILDRMHKENELRDHLDNAKKDLDDLPPKEKEALNEAYEKAKQKLDENPSIPEQENIKKNFDKAVEPLAENKKARQDLKDHAADAVKLAVEDPNTKDNEKKHVLKAKDDHVDKFLDKNPDADKKECEKQKEKFDDDVKKIVPPIEDKKELKEKVEELKENLQDPKICNNITPEEKEKLQGKLKELEKFIEEIEKKNPAQVKDKLKDVEKQVDPIIEKCEKRDELKNKADELEKRLDDPNDEAIKNLDDKDKDQLEKAIKHANEVANNPKASKDDLDKEKEKLDKIVDDIVAKADAKQDLLDKIEKTIDDVNHHDKLKPEEKEKILEKCKDLKDDILNHPDYSKKQLEDKDKDLDKSTHPLLDKEKPLLEALISGIKENVYGESDSSSSSSSSSDSETDRDDIGKDLDETANTLTSDYDSDNELPDDAKELKKHMKDLNDLLHNPEYADKLNDDEAEEIKDAIKDIKEILDGKDNHKDVDKTNDDISKILEPIADRIKETEKAKDEVEDLKKECEKLPEEDKKEIEKMLYDVNKELEKNPSKEELEKLQKKLDDVVPVIENAKARNDLVDHADKVIDEIEKDPHSTDADKDFAEKAKDELVDKFLEKNPDANKKDCEEQKDKFDDAVHPITKPIDDKKELKDTLDQIKDLLKDDEEHLTPDEKKVLEEAVKDAIKEDIPPQEVAQKLKEHEDTIKPIIDKVEEKKKLEDQADKIEDRLQDPKDNVNNHLSPQDREKLKDLVEEAKKAADSPTIAPDELKKEEKKLKDESDDILDKADKRGELVDKLDTCEKDSDKLTPEEKKPIQDKCKEIRNELEKDPNMSKKDLEDKIKELEEVAKPLEKKDNIISAMVKAIKNLGSDSSSSSSSSSSDSDKSLDAVEQDLKTHQDVAHKDLPINDDLAKEELPERDDGQATHNAPIEEDEDNEDACVITLKVCKKTGELKPHIVWKNPEVKFSAEMLKILTAQLLAGPPKK